MEIKHWQFKDTLAEIRLLEEASYAQAELLTPNQQMWQRTHILRVPMD
jgi:hypothetical protein